MSWLHYLLEANIYLGVFYALYFLLLDKETYYKLNRAYLLCTPVLSYIIPLIQVGRLKSYEDGGQVVTTIIYNPQLHQHIAATASYFTLQNILIYGYIAGTAIMLTVFIVKIFQLIKLIKSQKDFVDGRYKVVKIEDANTAFSFFNYVFIGANVSNADTMIRHELVHIDQKHSVDIVFLELVKIINWFNPFIYLLQRSLKTVHEYIADEHTAAYENDVLGYSSFLVSNAYGLSGSSISNSFFNYNLLKKRIIMLNQKRSGNLARLKYLIALPVCAGLLCASTLSFSKNYGLVDLAPRHRPDFGTPANNTADTSNLTSKGYKYAETGYLINGKTNYRVILTEKNGEQKAYFKNAATTAELKLLKEKYGYKFPSMPIYAKMPPPPPAPPRSAPTKSVKKMPPPPPPAPPRKITKAGTKGYNDAGSNPALHNVSAFAGLVSHISKFIDYPQQALIDKKAGDAVIKFDLKEDHTIGDVSITGIGYGTEKELVKAISSYDPKIEATTGTYNILVSYQISEANATGKAVTNNDPNNVGIVKLSGYTGK